MLENAQIDYLTGFFVRAALNPFLERLVLEGSLTGKNFSIALIDLDRFKKYNDKYSHAFGDEILKYATSTLRLTLRETECYFFRYGGDEFICVFPGKTSRETLRLIQLCNHSLMRRPFLYAEKLYKISISTGITGFPTDAKTTDDLIQKADKAMYFSKHHGRSVATLTSSIKYLRVIKFLFFISSVGIICICAFMLYQLVLKGTLGPLDFLKTKFKIKEARPAVKQEKKPEIRKEKKPEAPDKIILKNGVVFEGEILEETEDKVMFKFSLEQGQGVMSFQKQEIEEIKRSPRKPK